MWRFKCLLQFYGRLPPLPLTPRPSSLAPTRCWRAIRRQSAWEVPPEVTALSRGWPHAISEPAVDEEETSTLKEIHEKIGHHDETAVIAATTREDRPVHPYSFSDDKLTVSPGMGGTSMGLEAILVGGNPGASPPEEAEAVYEGMLSGKWQVQIRVIL